MYKTLIFQTTEWIGIFKIGYCTLYILYFSDYASLSKTAADKDSKNKKSAT